MNILWTEVVSLQLYLLIPQTVFTWNYKHLSEDGAHLRVVLIWKNCFNYSIDIFFIELTELTSDFDFIATEALIQGWGGVPVNIFWAKCTLNASLIESNHIFGFVQPK